MQENIITNKGRRTLVLGSGADVLLAALKKTQMVTGAVDSSIKETCTIYPSRLTSADVAELIRKIIEKGADLTLRIEGNESDNKLLDSVLAVARANGSVIEIDGVDASQEGLLDFVTSIFKSKDKDDNATQTWLKENIINGKLRPGLEIQDSVMTIDGIVAGMLYRDGKLVADVEKELRSDLQELKNIFNKHKASLIEASKLCQAIKKDIEALPSNVSWSKLKGTILKYHKVLPNSPVYSLSAYKKALLGNPTEGFTGREGRELVLKAEPRFKRARTVKELSLSKSQVEDLLKLQKELIKTHEEIELAGGKDWLYVGLDWTDPPLRRFEEKFYDDETATMIVDSFHNAEFDNRYTNLATNIQSRLTWMMNLIWEILRKSVKEVGASTESLSTDDIQEMTVVAHLTDAITLRKVPAGEDVEYIVFIPTEEAINESLVAYAQALETIKDKSHLVVLPQVEEVTEVTKALMELVIQNDGFITDDPETFKIIDQETDVSSESFKDVIKKIIDYFKPLPSDHINRVSRKVKRNLYWTGDIEKQNMLITQLLDDYLDNPEWMSKQDYKSGKISSTDFAYITSTGTVKVSELASDVAASAKSLNSLLKDFEKEAHVYLRELNKKIPYVDVAVGAGTYLPKDSVAFSVIVNTALNTLRSIPKPLQVMNFKNYPITGYTTTRELTRPPQELSMKVTVDSLDEKTFPLAVNALRTLVKEELHYVDDGAFVVRSLSPAVVNHLRGTDAGEELLGYCSESGFYSHSGWIHIPTPHAFRYRIAMGLITLMLSSLVIKDPRR